MKQLIPMIDYFLETVEWIKENDKVEKEKAFTRSIAIDRLTNYAKLLKQKPELFMFVPCDDNNVPLPDENKFLSCAKGYEYGKAREKVLFEGFSVQNKTAFNKGCDFVCNDLVYIFWHNGMEWEQSKDVSNIESLVKYNLTLSETALNLINSK